MEKFDLNEVIDWDNETVEEGFVESEKGEKPAKETSVEKETEDIDWEEDNPNPDAEEVETPSTPTQTPTQKKTSTSITVQAAQMLLDKGIIDFELEEGDELDDEFALELLEEGFESGVENRVKDLMTNLPVELQALNKYVLNGGDMNTFLSRLRSTPSNLTAGTDISKESNQELVIREMYLKEGMDEEFISDQIETLKDSGKLAAFAKKRFEKWKEDDKKAVQKATEEQERNARDQREKARQYYTNLKQAVSENNFDIVLSKKDLAEIPEYMTNRNIRMENNSIVTPFNYALMQVLQNESASVQLAKLLRDRKKDGTFDFSQIQKTGATQATKEIKNNIRRSKDNTPRKSVDMGTASRNLADYF